jgi:hypothetical protein
VALTAAVGTGAVAAIAVPWLLADQQGPLIDRLNGGLIHIPIGGIMLHWSWPIFCVVTLVVWGLLAAAKDR